MFVHPAAKKYDSETMLKYMKTELKKGVNGAILKKLENKQVL